MATRRVVTGIAADGTSYVVHDGPTTGSVDLGVIRLDDVWVDDPDNPDPDASRDPVAGDLALVPPRGGSVVRVGTLYPPSRADTPGEDAITRDLVRWSRGDAMESGPSGDEGWHTTATIDYGIVLSGRVELGLDDGWVELGPGDVVVQRATRHAWRLLGNEPCRIAWILIASPNYC
ncbi:MAG: cupin domain-containing protein [Actinomycetia bacterium]|nr:cupin domain-containing protein [Actinomycetes bacterium]MCP4228171.1 cupin domain-containing protein [Actinomycetes bacterium]